MKNSPAQKHNSQDSSVPWRLFLFTTIETFGAFYVATFCLAVYFSFKGDASLFITIGMVMLYLLLIVILARRIIKKLPLAALMLVIPIAPLLALITVVTLIPVLQLLLKH